MERKKLGRPPKSPGGSVKISARIALPLWHAVLALAKLNGITATAALELVLRRAKL